LTVNGKTEKERYDETARFLWPNRVCRHDGLAGAAVAQEKKGAQPTVEPRKPKAVVKLSKSPEGFPNGLENTPEGLWIAEEISERAYLVDWNGKVLHRVQAESHNVSGIGAGGGYLWMG